MDIATQKGDDMEAFKFGLELAVAFLFVILALFIAYYKISEKILTKKLKSGKTP